MTQPEYKFDTVPNEQEFTDPVLRCDSCNELVKRKTLHVLGACGECGNKRVRNLTTFNDEEKAQLEKWGFQSFVDEFQAVEGE